MEKERVGFVSKQGGPTLSNTKGRNNVITNRDRSIGTKRSVSGSPRPSIMVSQKKVKTEADWFEKYAIEKTKNERLVKRL